ncbi:uncharacterized protein N7483_008546 [Penicillium malachiteum]|uniref:uncharacterized protein n=1 Tax=Penicillium malachiteum TaxID=1324776 RepID=UPI0025478E65|nr:uncharacterized protein N7483_008546 [Penicillium malachiteum]KAJ5720612.1 hypothetical protein N7483_008546 [Penicillium malachiteum]
MQPAGEPPVPMAEFWDCAFIVDRPTSNNLLSEDGVFSCLLQTIQAPIFCRYGWSLSRLVLSLNQHSFFSSPAARPFLADSSFNSNTYPLTMYGLGSSL